MTQSTITATGPHVVVHVPANAIKTADDFAKIAIAAFRKGGCPTCFSGLDIRFTHLRDFVVNPQTLDLHEVAIER